MIAEAIVMFKNSGMVALLATMPGSLIVYSYGPLQFHFHRVSVRVDLLVNFAYSLVCKALALSGKIKH